MKSNKSAKEIKDKFKAFFDNRSEEQKIRHDEYMLMASFLSEIERIQNDKKIKRNKLADIIKTSASYLTQVFRGDKPLNFHTLAKIQRALNIKFSVRAHYRNELIEDVFNVKSDLELYKFYETHFHPYSDILTKKDPLPDKWKTIYAGKNVQ